MSEGPDLHRLAGLRASGNRRRSAPPRRRSAAPGPPDTQPSRASGWLLLVVQLLAVAAVAFYASQHPLVPAHRLEGDVYWRYLLHSLLGLGLGLAFAALVTGLRGGRPSGAVGWAVLGAVLAVIPDLVYTANGHGHRRWMDYFLAHLSIDTAPQPLLVALGLFVLGGWAWWAASRRHVAAAALLVLATAGLLAGTLAVHGALPVDVSNVPRAL